MAQVCFRCSNAERMLPSRCDAEVDDITEARAQAACVVSLLIASPGPEDWRGWVLHVSDDLGEEIFTLPFSSMLGRLN